MIRATAPVLLPTIALLALALGGCAGPAADDPAPGTDTGTTDGGSTDDGGSDDGATDGGALDCSAATTAGYDLFLDPALTVDPVLDVYPLEAGDSITFTDAGYSEEAYASYGWTSSYIQSDGSVAPSTGSFFFEDEGGLLLFEGPEAVAGIDGGPYTGFLDIEKTEGTTTTVLGRVCVQFALTE